MAEVAFALDENKIVIPVLHRDCKIPLRLRRLQYIDARAEYERVLDALIRMLASREEGEESLRSTTLLNGDPVVRASAAERPIIEKTNQERLFQESAEAKRHVRKAQTTKRDEVKQERMARDIVDAYLLSNEKAEQERLARQKMEQARREHNDSAGRLRAPAEKLVGANAEPARDESPSGYYSNLTAIATGLKEITESGFLIVAFGEIYVQFLGDRSSFKHLLRNGW